MHTYYTNVEYYQTLKLEVDLKELIAKIDMKLNLSRFGCKYHRLSQLFNFIYILIKVLRPDKLYETPENSGSTQIYHLCAAALAGDETDRASEIEPADASAKTHDD